MADNFERYQLGSGTCYLKAVEGDIDTSDVDALITEYFVEANRWGYTKNGATITYTPTTYNVYSDLREIDDVFLTGEEVTIALGTLTVDGEILKKTMPTARIDTTTTGRQVVKVGGLENDNGESYFIGFHHIDKAQGDTYVIVTGKNSGELSFAFNPDNETILNPTFTAKSMDKEGTKLIVVFGKKGE